MRETLLKTINLSRYFTLGKGLLLKAVNGVSLSVYKGETFGLVGESGCGKTTLGRTVIGLYPATKGQIQFDGIDISTKNNKKQKKELSRRLQMVFQDPYTSLNPRMKVMDIIAEGIDNHHLASSKKERSDMVFDLLNSVGLDTEHANRYPHEFSGGQRQRIGIARALSVDPEFIVADEPISALDVSIQAQIVNLLKRLQEKRGLTYLFIAHDLSMVKYISDRIGVMYMGSLVEVAGSNELFQNPIHPYTKALLSSIPVPDPKIERKRERIILKGGVESPVNLPSNCHFWPRCPIKNNFCKIWRPELREISQEHYVACHTDI